MPCSIQGCSDSGRSWPKAVKKMLIIGDDQEISVSFANFKEEHSIVNNNIQNVNENDHVMLEL